MKAGLRSADIEAIASAPWVYRVPGKGMRVDYCPMGFPIGGVIYTVIALGINTPAFPFHVIFHELEWE